MSEPSSTPPSPVAASESFDPQRRRLCADDSCVGLVGADGRCRVCGLAHPEGAGAPVSFTTIEDVGADDLEQDAEDDAGLPLEATSGDPDAGFNPSRGLCPDGSCVGVLGPDGRCKVCGRGPEAAAGGTGA
jgi:hypothetical protein